MPELVILVMTLKTWNPSELKPADFSQDDLLAEHMAECLGEGVLALVLELPIQNFKTIIQMVFI